MTSINKAYQIGLLWIITLLCSPLCGQIPSEHLGQLDNRLEALIESGLPLTTEISVSFTGSIQELVTFLAESTELSIGIAPQIRKQVSVSFTSVQARDIILYLCDTYSLTIRPTGNIVYLIAYEAEPPPPESRLPNISYNVASGLLQLDLKRDTLLDVIRLVSELTGENVVVDPVLQRKLVSGFINNVEINDALAQLALNNNLELTSEAGIPYLTEKPKSVFFEPDQNSTNGNKAGIRMRKTAEDRISVQAEGVTALEVISTIAKELDLQYYILEDYEVAMSANSNGSTSNNRTSNRGNNRTSNTSGRSSESRLNKMIVSLVAKDATYNEILNNIFRNSDYTYDRRGDVYIIGARDAEGLRKSRIVQFQYRSARGMIDLVPPTILRNVKVDSLYELNSLVLTGSEKNIGEIVDFLSKLDRVVPVVNIELTILDVSTTKLEELGVEAGVTPGGEQAGGTIISSSENQGGIDFGASPGAINRILDLLAGRGVVNIGRVTPDFYLRLKALQGDGIIDIQSTPKLSTLNSHPALLSIGTKRYYQEQQVNFPGQQLPIPVQSTIFKEVEANLLISINPIVSGDEEVTLEVYFEQTDFIGDTGPNAPPPQVSRKFESIVRVRNGETIVLGGLERKLDSRTRRGVPFLSKIPLIGWMFGSKRKNKQQDKLLILIKPTIIN